MESDRRTLAVDESINNKKQVIIIGGRATLVNSEALDARGRVVRPELLPPGIHRLNRRERRKLERRANRRW